MATIPQGVPIRRTKLGQTSYDYRDDEETEHIVNMLASGKSTLEAAAASGWSFEQVRTIRAQYFPTTGLAQHYLRANALTLAKRIVLEANVEEAVDILSRPNLGVLRPHEKPGAVAPTQVLTSVRPEHLGGVQVAVMVGHPPSTPEREPLEEGTSHGWLPTATVAPLLSAFPSVDAAADVRQGVATAAAVPPPQTDQRPRPARRPVRHDGQRRRRKVTKPAKLAKSTKPAAKPRLVKGSV